VEIAMLAESANCVGCTWRATTHHPTNELSGNRRPSLTAKVLETKRDGPRKSPLVWLAQRPANTGLTSR
jgi:hypothetical protein